MRRWFRKNCGECAWFDGVLDCGNERSGFHGVATTAACKACSAFRPICEVCGSREDPGSIEVCPACRRATCARCRPGHEGVLAFVVEETAEAQA